MKLLPRHAEVDGDDITAAVRYLVSPAAGYVTGQVLGVNGGSVLGR